MKFVLSLSLLFAPLFAQANGHATVEVLVKGTACSYDAAGTVTTCFALNSPGEEMLTINLERTTVGDFVIDGAELRKKISLVVPQTKQEVPVELAVYLSKIPDANLGKQAQYSLGGLVSLHPAEDELRAYSYVSLDQLAGFREFRASENKAYRLTQPDGSYTEVYADLRIAKLVITD